MSKFYTVMEGLTDTITRRYRKAKPELTVSQNTTAVKVDRSGVEDGALPIGYNSTVVKAYEDRVRLMRTRRGMYREYDEMDDESPEFSSALDIFADNATRGDSDGSESITIKSDNPRVAEVLNELCDRLNLDSIIWTLARDIAKYGERAEEIIINDKYEIVRLKPLPTLQIIPQVDEYGRKKYPWAYIQVAEDDPEKVEARFYDWQVIYFANKKSRSDLIGRGVGHSARRPFKQLRMMEDAVVIARLTRAHNRIAYMVDTGKLTPEEAQAHLERVKRQLRKRRTVNPHTGKMDLDWNPLSIEEDIFVAVNKDSKADVKVLQGDLTLGNLRDLEYFQQKIFTALKVPKTYLQHEKDTRNRNVVSYQDMQFARSVRRIQNVIQQGFRKLFDLQLILKGFDLSKVSYTVGLPVISIVDDLREWQTWQLKMLVAQMFKQTLWPSDDWLLRNLLGYDEDEVQQLLKGQEKPDPYNGLYQAPRVGNVPNNMKSQTPESDAAVRGDQQIREVELKQAIDTLAATDPDKFAEFMEAVDNLRMLLDWQRESQE